jgi:hypothetical protein
MSNATTRAAWFDIFKRKPIDVAAWDGRLGWSTLPWKTVTDYDEYCHHFREWDRELDTFEDWKDWQRFLADCAPWLLS